MRKGTQPLFSHVFQISPESKSDSIEICTIDRASKVIEYVFQENVFTGSLHGFLSKALVL